ncbi:MAG: hypothetical protein U0R51_08285 [Solirubrobacterales bacterium]
MSDQRIAKWTRWIDESPIGPNIHAMFHRRDIWNGVQEIVKDNPDLPPSAFWEFQFEIYAEAQAMAVRRQADTHPDVASLAKLLGELKDDAERITFDWWFGLWGDDADAHILGLARQQWANHYGEGESLDAAIPATDLERITAASSSVRTYVNENVAHSEARGPIPPEVAAREAEDIPTLDDIHAAIDVAGDLYKKYYGLFTASTLVDVTPIVQHDWRAPFRMPWIVGQAT